MKKILCLSLALILLLGVALLPAPVYAAEDSVSPSEDTPITVYGDWNYAMHGNRRYRIFRDNNVSTPSNVEFDYLTVDFENIALAYQYRYITCYAYGDDYGVCAISLQTQERKYESVYLVAEPVPAETEAFFSEGKAAAYATQGSYPSLDALPLSATDVADWKASSRVLRDRADQFSNYFSFDLYATDKTGILRQRSGLILRDVRNGDNYYLIDFSEYDRSYFYADGSFALDTDEEISLYLLEDKDLADALSKYYETVPDDDLLLFEEREPLSDKAILIITAIFFILIPLAVIFTCIGVILVKKPKKIYRVLLWIIAGCEGIVILATSVILLCMNFNL